MNQKFYLIFLSFIVVTVCNQMGCGGGSGGDSDSTPFKGTTPKILQVEYLATDYKAVTAFDYKTDGIVRIKAQDYDLNAKELYATLFRENEPQTLKEIGPEKFSTQTSSEFTYDLKATNIIDSLTPATYYFFFVINDSVSNSSSYSSKFQIKKNPYITLVQFFKSGSLTPLLTNAYSKGDSVIIRLTVEDYDDNCKTLAIKQYYETTTAPSQEFNSITLPSPQTNVNHKALYEITVSGLTDARLQTGKYNLTFVAKDATDLTSTTYKTDFTLN